VWQKQVGGTGNDYGMGILLSPDHTRLYVFGAIFSSSIEYPPGATISRGTGWVDSLLLVMQASDGGPLSGGRFLPTSTGVVNTVTAVDVDPNTNDVYVAGYTNAATFGSHPNRGGYDAFLVRLNASFVVQWTQLSGGTDNDLAHAVAFSPHHQGAFVFTQCASAFVYPSAQSNSTLNGTGSSDALLVGFHAQDGVMLLGTDFSNTSSIDTSWNATTADIVGAASSDVQPTVTVPYALRDTNVVIQLTLATGASLWFDEVAVASRNLTVRAPNSGFEFAAVSFNVQAEDVTFFASYTLRVAVEPPPAGWSVGIRVGGFSGTVTDGSAVGARTVELPSDARAKTVQLSFSLSPGATIDQTLTGGNASLIAPADPSSPASDFTFTVTSQDGSLNSGAVTLNFSIVAATGNAWTSVSTTFGGATATLLSVDSGIASLQLPAAAARQSATLSFALDAFASVVDGAGMAGPSATSLLVHCPDSNETIAVAFGVVSESGVSASYALQLSVAPSSEVSWTAVVSGGSAFEFTAALSSDSAVNERAVLLPSSSRGLPFELALTFARNSTVDPADAALPISLTAPASPSDSAVEYSFNVTAQDGVTSSGRIVLRFAVAPFTDCNVSVVASVPSLNFTSSPLSSNNSAAGSSSSVTELSLPLPSAAAARNVTLTFTLPPFAALTDGATLVQQVTAAAVGGALSLNFSVVAESGTVRSYALRLATGVDEEQLNDGDGESESSGLTNAERNAAIAVPVIVGGVALIALAAFALHRWSRPKTSGALPPPPSSTGVVSSAGVASAHAGDGSANEMAVLPAAPQADGGANASGVVVVHVK
jgi:hypothetical protein